MNVYQISLTKLKNFAYFINLTFVKLVKLDFDIGFYVAFCVTYFIVIIWILVQYCSQQLVMRWRETWHFKVHSIYMTLCEACQMNLLTKVFMEIMVAYTSKVLVCYESKIFFTISSDCLSFPTSQMCSLKSKKSLYYYPFFCDANSTSVGKLKKRITASAKPDHCNHLYICVLLVFNFKAFFVNSLHLTFLFFYKSVSVACTVYLISTNKMLTG